MIVAKAGIGRAGGLENNCEPNHEANGEKKESEQNQVAMVSPAGTIGDSACVVSIIDAIDECLPRILIGNRGERGEIEMNFGDHVDALSCRILIKFRS